MTNFDVARLFYEMANLLEVKGESAFRVRAYQRAAQQIESLAEDLAAVAARGELQKIPGIGKDLAARITEGIEINCSPDRLDLKDSHARRAAELGVPIAISTDTHYLSNLDNLDLGIATARRGWIGPAQVLNTRNTD